MLCVVQLLGWLIRRLKQFCSVQHVAAERGCGAALWFARSEAAIITVCIVEYIGSVSLLQQLYTIVFFH